VRRALQRLESAQFIERQMEGRMRVIRLHPEGDGEPVAEYTLRLTAG
jgi:DNA-binding GntR family transcriptional regulator